MLAQRACENGIAWVSHGRSHPSTSRYGGSASAGMFIGPHSGGGGFLYIRGRRYYRRYDCIDSDAVVLLWALGGIYHKGIIAWALGGAIPFSTTIRALHCGNGQRENEDIVCEIPQVHVSYDLIVGDVPCRNTCCYDVAFVDETIYPDPLRGVTC